MDTIAIGTNLTVEDWRALQTQAAARMASSQSASGPWLRLLGSTILFTVLALAIAGWLGSGVALDAKSVVAGALIVFVATVVNARLALRRAAPAANGLFLGPCVFELNHAGLRAGREDSNSFCAWHAVHEVTRTDTHAFLWVDRFSAYVIPGRDLPGGLTLEGLADWIAAARAGAAAEPAHEPEPATTPVERAAPAAQPPQSSGAWLLDLVNLVALRGKAVRTQSSHGSAATLLTLLAVGTWVALTRWASGPGAVFYVYGIPTVAWYLLGGLVIAWLLARASIPRIALARAIAVSALGAWLAVLYFHLSDWIPSRWASLALVVAAVLYVPTYFAQAARALTGQAQPLAGLAAFLGTLAFFWGTESLYIYPTVWVPGEAEAEDETAFGRYDIEPLLFAQPERVDAAVAAVPAGDPVATDWFFVGFAGYADEKVFAEEIQFAARVVGERYRRGTRSVLLLNDQRDLDTAPLATASTLRRTLRGVADKMALDDDVLFLALSSHGSSDGELSVRNGMMPLANLTPEELDGALDDAGIRWRVIVISACYAGGFIETLQDPYTIVLAAAAPDRTSFGCSNERELTYFGEAFYRDALPVAASLRGAFTTAERLVGEREAAEAITPSQPIAFFGEELERKLESLEGRP